MTLAISEELLDRFSDYLARSIGLHFPKERWSDLERKLQRAALEFGFEDAESCARWLMLSSLTKSQVEVCASHFTVGETYFFRDQKIFNLFEDRIFPELIQKRRNAGRHLRIWSAGCATGEEPYSIAILLRKILHDIDDWNIAILASDINPTFLRKASEGVYGEWSFRNAPPWLKERYFMKTGRGRFEVRPEVRKHVTFSYHNLAKDSYPSLMNNTNALDIIFCRNVLMYFSRDLQGKVVEKFYHCLVDGGRLIVSPTETSTAQSSPFLQVHFSEATHYLKDMNKTFILERTAPPEPSSFGDAQAMLRSSSTLEFFAKPAAVAGASLEKPAGREESGVRIPQAPDLYGEALSSYERGQYENAEEKIKTLLAGDAGHAPALALLSRVRAGAGALPDARELCEKAVAADKLNPRYHYLLATILQEMGLPEESAASLKRALYLDQNFVLAHFALGNLALRQRKNREAERHFRNALAALRTFQRDDILPESEGVAAGRMEEIIETTMGEEALT